MSSSNDTFNDTFDDKNDDDNGDYESLVEIEQDSPGRLWKVLIPVVVLLLAAGGTAALFNAREAPPRIERKSLGPLVETLEVAAADVPLSVSGHGEVSARIEVDLLPEVPGKVTWAHPDLRSGGRFAAGETLLLIDDRDYRLAVQRAQAAVARARTVLEREQAEAEVALQEWRAMHGEETPPNLLVRGPQIRQADAELAAARADLAAAELGLDRTRLSLPFDGIVVSETVSPGQYVTTGRVIATVFGTDAVEVRVPLADAELAWFDVSARPEATVRADLAGRSWAWRGVVERLEGQVDPKSRMVHVVVRVDRPFDRAGRPPLLPGTFVDIAIAGRTLRNVVELPRHALRQDGIVWAAQEDPDEEGASPVLRLRQVEVVRTDRRNAYVRGLEPGDRVILSSLDAPVEGMAVRLVQRSSQDSSLPTSQETVPATGASS